MQNTVIGKAEAIRVEYIDSLKGFAIFCVLWGHSIQYLKDQVDFFNNEMFAVIYSFHVPLFFVVSGFFFSSSLKLPFKTFLYKKSIQLLVPCLVWTVILKLYFIINSHLTGVGNYKPLYEFGTLIDPRTWNLWFLRELFISFLILYILYKVVKVELLVFVFSIIFIFIAPSGEYQRFLLPMFLLGVFMKNRFHQLIKNSTSIVIISGLIFIILLLFWKGSYTIYATGFPSLFSLRTFRFNLTNIDIAAFRLLIGIAGSLFFFFLFAKLYRPNLIFLWLKKVGSQTLAIYVVQSLILESLINDHVDFARANTWIYNLVITPVITCLVILLCIRIIKIANRNKWSRFILFGSK